MAKSVHVILLYRPTAIHLHKHSHSNAHSNTMTSYSNAIIEIGILIRKQLGILIRKQWCAFINKPGSNHVCIWNYILFQYTSQLMSFVAWNSFTCVWTLK